MERVAARPRQATCMQLLPPPHRERVAAGTLRGTNGLEGTSCTDTVGILTQSAITSLYTCSGRANLFDTSTAHRPSTPPTLLYNLSREKMIALTKLRA